MKGRTLVLAHPAKAGGVLDFVEIMCDALASSSLRVRAQPLVREEPFVVAPGDVVVVQYSGYGYAKRGAPLWLIERLGDLRRQGTTVGVFFHELFAFGWPWRSSFWLSPAQRYVARRLARLSDFWATNRGRSGAWLHAVAGDKPHFALPIVSTIGEPAMSDRPRAAIAVVFGGAGWREATYAAGGDELFAWARRLGIQIHDIGDPIADTTVVRQLAQGGVRVHGRLPKAEISAVLREGSLGLMAYPSAYLPKSTIFAAYCAHGVCPVVLGDGPAEPAGDGLALGQHYIDQLPDDAGVKCSQIGRSAWHWYQPHRVEMHARALQEVIGTLS